MSEADVAAIEWPAASEGLPPVSAVSDMETARVRA